MSEFNLASADFAQARIQTNENGGADSYKITITLDPQTLAFSTIPEPGSPVLLGLAILAASLRRRR